MLSLQNSGPPKLQRLDEPMYGSPPNGNPYLTFLESPSSHDFQRGEVGASSDAFNSVLSKACCYWN